MHENSIVTKATIDSYEAPWMLKKLSSKQLNTLLPQLNESVQIFEHSKQQSVSISTAIAQRQHAIKLVNNIIKSSHYKSL